MFEPFFDFSDVSQVGSDREFITDVDITFGSWRDFTKERVGVNLRLCLSAPVDSFYSPISASIARGGVRHDSDGASYEPGEFCLA